MHRIEGSPDYRSRGNTFLQSVGLCAAGWNLLNLTDLLIDGVVEIGGQVSLLDRFLYSELDNQSLYCNPYIRPFGEKFINKFT
jgi:hypothetical protein